MEGNFSTLESEHNNLSYIHQFIDFFFLNFVSLVINMVCLYIKF